MNDVLILGAGPAGISAALYTKRANMSTIVLHNNQSNLQKAYQIDNYYGVGKISGKDLYQKGIEQAKALSIPVFEEEVLQITEEEGFTVTTTKNVYHAKNLVLATGKYRKLPSIPGLKENIGQGISLCAICDAFFYKNKKVAILGEGEFLHHEAMILQKVTSDVTLLSNGKEEKDSISQKIENVEVSSGVVVTFEDHTKMTFDGLFLAYGVSDIDTLSSTLGIMKEKNFIKVDENNQTNIPGIYACGDLTGGTLQVAKAVYEGMNAVLAIIKKEGKK